MGSAPRHRAYRLRLLLSAVGLVAAAALGGCSAPLPAPTPSAPQPAATPTLAAGNPSTATPAATASLLPLSSNPDSPTDPPAKAVRGGPPVRAAPDEASPIISGLYYDAPLPLLEERVDPDGTRWYRTRLWGVLEGWINADHLTTEPAPPLRPFWEGPPARRPTPGASPSQALSATGATNCLVVLRTGPGTDYRSQRVLSPGTPVQVLAWATDANAHAWYRVEAGQSTGWLYAAAVDLNAADPRRPSASGEPLAARVAGKGMWLPQPLLEMADEKQIVEASRQTGLTHIFVEVAETSSGFYGKTEVARLLPAAHAAGLRVIGWITTSLYDLPRDVALSAEVANYRTADGHSLDGIAPDIEQNMELDDVKAFADILRATLGDDALIVGVVYPAGGWFGREYPIQPSLARVFNALAPMAYWSDEQRAYADKEVYEYIAKSVRDMQAAAGEGYPVHVIGQMYDTFGRNGSGAYSPGYAEIDAALRAAREAGAVGISFFQWGTATPEEWAALRDFAW